MHLNKEVAERQKEARRAENPLFWREFDHCGGLVMQGLALACGFLPLMGLLANGLGMMSYKGFISLKVAL